MASSPRSGIWPSDDGLGRRSVLVDPDTWFDDDDPLGAAVARGYADGSLAADLPGDWIGTFVWTSLFAAHLVVSSGSHTWHEAAGLLTRTLTSGLAGPARP